MKVKIDFVSNSSTTSFCIWGIEIGDKNIIKSLENRNLEGLSLYSRPYYDDCWVGLHVENMREDETLREFKERIVEYFQKIPLNVFYKDLQLIEEAWVDN